MTDDYRIPIIEEEAHVEKRSTTERVRVHMTTETEQVLVQDVVSREHIEVTHVPVGREVVVAPPVRTEDGTTIVPVLEERLVVERRLFLVEEIHIRKTTHEERVELPAELRRTRVDVERDDPMTQEENIYGRT
jgi:stress response protein YsnF